jgi:voltage-gated potassium channel
MFYFTAKVDGFSPTTWIVRYDLQDLPKEIKYLKSLYFTITILTTVGFGDIVPYTSSEMILCIAWMSLGIGFYSAIVSTISSVFRSMDSRRFMISEKISSLDKLGKFYEVNRNSLKYIKQKVNDHIKDDEKICDYDKKKISKKCQEKYN